MAGTGTGIRIGTGIGTGSWVLRPGHITLALLMGIAGGGHRTAAKYVRGSIRTSQ
ncbi:hypothetical protein chiPu_0028005, partial [Chiloscyllium punctatum]|nr:hypothetical protein [Chiloscyllium punctatum]